MKPNNKDIKQLQDKAIQNSQAIKGQGGGRSDYPDQWVIVKF